MKGYLKAAAAVGCILVFFAVSSPVSGAAKLTPASSAPSATKTPGGVLGEISSMLGQSEPLVSGIQAIVSWELESSQTSSGESSSQAEDSSQAAVDAAELKAKHDELKGYVTGLDGLKTQAGALPAAGTDSVKKTVAAAQEYFARLSGASDDLLTVYEYGMALEDALTPMVEWNAPDDGTDASALADSLSQVIAKCQDNMAALKSPDYLADTQKDLEDQLAVFQKFCEDFAVAAELGDPLRLTSDMQRLARLQIQLGICSDNLNQDIDLQFTQTQKRLGGSTGKLHDELKANIAVLTGGK